MRVYYESIFEMILRIKREFLLINNKEPNTIELTKSEFERLKDASLPYTVIEEYIMLAVYSNIIFFNSISFMRNF